MVRLKSTKLPNVTSKNKTKQNSTKDHAAEGQPHKNAKGTLGDTKSANVAPLGEISGFETEIWDFGLKLEIGHKAQALGSTTGFGLKH